MSASGLALRKVVNLLPNPSFSTGAPAGWSTPSATLASNTLTNTATGGRLLNDVTPVPVAGSSVVFTVDAAPGSVGTLSLTIYDSTAAVVRTQVQSIVVPRRQKFYIRYDSWVSGNSCVCYIHPNNTSGSAGDSIKVYQAQLEKVDGQYNQNFSEVASGTNYYAYIPQCVYCWGDSLTVMYYPQYIRTLYGNAGTELWVQDGGVGGDTSTQIATRMLAKPEHFGDGVVIWAGRNNYSDGTTVKANIASMIAALGHTRYLVLSVINGPLEPSPNTGYGLITTLNADLAALYPNNYLDIRSLLVAQYNPSLPQDVIDHGNDVPPTSLRIDVTNLHLNLTGYEYVATQVRNFIIAKGWPTAPKVIA